MCDFGYKFFIRCLVLFNKHQKELWQTSLPLVYHMPALGQTQVPQYTRTRRVSIDYGRFTLRWDWIVWFQARQWARLDKWSGQRELYTQWRYTDHVSALKFPIRLASPPRYTFIKVVSYHERGHDFGDCRSRRRRGRRSWMGNFNALIRVQVY